MTTPDQTCVRLMALGYRISQALYVFAELGIADILAGGPTVVAEIAARARADDASVRRLLRIGRALGLVWELPGDAFELTGPGRALIRDAEDSLWPRVRAVGDAWQWHSWGQLLETVRTGESAFEREYAANSFEYFDSNPGAGETMMGRVTDEAVRRGKAICGAYDFSSVDCLVDIGGGRGAVLAEILSRHHQLRGVLVDLPYAVSGAAEVLADYAVVHRCEVVSADFRDDPPVDGDACLLSAVLHSWSDEESVALLRQCLRRYGVVVVVDEAVDPAGASLSALLKDLQLMVFSGGRLRGLREYRTLFERAGGTLVRSERVDGDEFLMEGRIIDSEVGP